MYSVLPQLDPTSYNALLVVFLHHQDHPVLTGHPVGRLAPHGVPALVVVLRDVGTLGLQCHVDKLLYLIVQIALSGT